MKSRLPATPQDTLSMSGALRFIVNTLFKGADLFRRWKYPLKKTPADFEDWSLLQKIYWAYKCKKPILRAEKGSGLETFFKDNSRQGIELPEGFEKKSVVTFGAVGDLYKAEGQENSKDLLYEEAADLIFAKDISYANLESQLTEQKIDELVFDKNETPPLCSTREQFETLKGHKGKTFTVMQTANNHTLDMGLEGVETTLRQLQKDGIIDIGTNRRAVDREKGKIIEKKGIKTGFVSATYGLNDRPVPAGKEYIVNVVKFHKQDGEPDLSLLEKQIAHCREQQCDFIIASLHWGYEYEFFPRQHQVEIAHQLVESGADLIVSHHAHVIQPMEYYRTERDPDRIALITYSLGNLTSSYSAPHLVLSRVLDLSISKGIFKGEQKTYIEKAELIPVVQMEEEVKGLPIFRIKKLSSLKHLSKESADKEEKEYIDKVIYYEGLPEARKTIVCPTDVA
ncbi:MAG: CapA family protein [Candidatus Aminicenantes bacterium]|nr:CapA family protein [Candidatus Aminicenantes bacterium]